MAHRISRSKCKPKSGQRFFVDNVGYELRGRIGDGAAGLVRKAVTIDGTKAVAVKFLAPDPKYISYSAFGDVARRFSREGKRGSHLNHDHLLKIIAYCDNENGNSFKSNQPKNPFIIMDFIDGRTLESYIKSVPRPESGKFVVNRPRLNIAIQIALALEFLRDQKLIHRDVKPANIFLMKRFRPAIWLAKIGDFGVMKWGDFHAAVATGTLTVTSQKGLGTLKYMSPEQAIRPKKVTIKSDIWSLGITLFELFTGQILSSAHHVYEIQNARRSRGNTFRRFYEMGYRIPSQDESLAEMILDMFLAPKGRPSIDSIRGRLQWEYESRFGNEWNYDYYTSQIKSGSSKTS